MLDGQILSFPVDCNLCGSSSHVYEKSKTAYSEPTDWERFTREFESSPSIGATSTLNLPDCVGLGQGARRTSSKQFKLSTKGTTRQRSLRGSSSHGEETLRRLAMNLTQADIGLVVDLVYMQEP